MRRFKSVLAAVALVAAATMVAACSDSGPTPEDIAGDYVLTSVAGRPVPATVNLPNQSFVVESGSLAVRVDLTCTFVRVIDTITLTDQCTYTLNEERMTVEMLTLQETWTGLITRSIITLTNPDGISWEFQLP
jgi:hypothetical protein